MKKEREICSYFLDNLGRWLSELKSEQDVSFLDFRNQFSGKLGIKILFYFRFSSSFSLSVYYYFLFSIALSIPNHPDIKDIYAFSLISNVDISLANRIAIAIHHWWCNDPPIFSAFILKAAVSRLQELQVIAHCVRSKDRIISLPSARTQIAAHSRVQHYYTMWQKSLHRKMIEGVDAWSRQRTHVVR